MVRTKAIMQHGFADFSKSFSRCSHQEILRAYARLNASNWLIHMHKAFLENRYMTVKIGTHLSDSLKVLGGAVQGSVLGVLDHNAVLEDLDDEMLDIYTAKYIDDLTMVETIEKSIPYLLATDDLSNVLHRFVPPQSQAALHEIVRKATVKDLKINDEKTQLLSISCSSHKCLASLKDMNDKTIDSGRQIKMLGFIFDEKPTVHAQLDYIIRKANKRYFPVFLGSCSEAVAFVRLLKSK